MTEMEIDHEVILGKKISIVTFFIQKQPIRYLIGVQIAKLLQRQTFNMYRSMKSKRTRVVRATQSQIKLLLDRGVVPRNTHSVTLIPYEDGLEYITNLIKREAIFVPSNKNPQDPAVQFAYLEQCAILSLCLLSFGSRKRPLLDEEQKNLLDTSELDHKIHSSPHRSLKDFPKVYGGQNDPPNEAKFCISSPNVKLDTDLLEWSMKIATTNHDLETKGNHLCVSSL
jgi:hypothetical protein